MMFFVLVSVALAGACRLHRSVLCQSIAHELDHDMSVQGIEPVQLLVWLFFFLAYQL